MADDIRCRDTSRGPPSVDLLRHRQESLHMSLGAVSSSKQANESTSASLTKAHPTAAERQLTLSGDNQLGQGQGYDHEEDVGRPRSSTCPSSEMHGAPPHLHRQL
jgi:hypothetical protein